MNKFLKRGFKESNECWAVILSDECRDRENEESLESLLANSVYNAVDLGR